MMGWISSFIKWLSTPFGGGPVPGKDPKVDAIQAAAVKACGFLPLAETVASIIGASAPGVLTATSAANYICNIVTKTAPIPTAQTLYSPNGRKVESWQAPDGTLIQGTFVNK